MSITLIISAIVGLFTLIAGAFGLGHAKGTATAQAKNEQQQAAADVVAATAVADTRVNTVKEAQKVEQTINALPDADVDQQLQQWRKPPSTPKGN